MNMGKKITELREGTKIPRESRYVVEMGDGTGTKQVKHHNLVAQLLEDMSLGYDETMEFLNGTGIAEGNEALRAFRDWLVSRVVNNLMTTEAGFFLDGRAGKTLADGLAEINSNLALTRGTADKGEKFNLGASYYIWGRMCFVTLESTPSSDVSNGDVVLTGLPLPCTVIYLSLQTAGGDYSARIRRDGTLEIYFPSYKTASRIDTSFCYIT